MAETTKSRRGDDTSLLAQIFITTLSVFLAFTLSFIPLLSEHNHSLQSNPLSFMLATTGRFYLPPYPTEFHSSLCRRHVDLAMFSATKLLAADSPRQFSLEAFVKLTAYITYAPQQSLWGGFLGNTLANRPYRAGNSLRAACHGVRQVLDANSLHWKHSRDTIVLALSLLLKFRLNYDYLSMPIPPQIFVVVAVRAAYTLTHDSFPSNHKWYLMTQVRSRSLSQMGPFFLHHVRDAGLLSEDEYQDFVGRPEVVWVMIKDIKLDDLS